MATRLNQVLHFAAVPAGAQATLPHAINVNGLAVLPDLLLPTNSSFALVSSTTTSITVINNALSAQDLDLWLWRQDTPDRAYGAKSTTNLTPQPLFVGSGGSGIAPATPVYGYVKLDPYMIGTTDLSVAFNGALAALGSFGGTIDARNVNPTGYNFLSTVTINKPITILLGPGEYPSAVPLMFAITTIGFPAANVVVRGMDPLGSRLTAFTNGTIFKLDGDFYDFAGDGKPFFSVSNLTLDGLAGTSCAINANNAGATLNFQDGLILVEDCCITRCGNVNGAVWIGPSVYFVRIHRNEFIDNQAALFLDNNTEVSVTENMFVQGAGTSSPTIMSIGPMHRFVNNYFYRHGITDTSTSPDILLQPEGAFSEQSGGFVWIEDNRFGGERENFTTVRNRIRLFATDPALIAGPAIVRGNQFLGPGAAVDGVVVAGGTATITLLPAGIAGTLTVGQRVAIRNSIVPAVNGTWTVTAKTANTFSFALAGTVSGGAGGQAGLADNYAISLENASLSWDLSANLFAGYGILVNDAQPSIVPALNIGNGQFLDNRVMPQENGCRIFVNEGREFGITRLQGTSALVPWNGDPRIVETPSLLNRLPASEALNTWLTNVSGGSVVVVTGGQADPNGGTSAFLVTMSGTGSSQWVGQEFFTADLAVLSRVTVKFWAKAGTLTSLAIGVAEVGTQNFVGGLTSFTLSPQWKEYKIVMDGLPTVGGTAYQLLFYPGNGDELTGTVSLWQPQVSDLDSNHLPNLHAFNVIAATTDTVNGARFEKGVIMAQAVIGDQVGAPPITSGVGVPGGVPTVGSMYLRTDGGVGSTLYVCEVAGAWQAK